MIKSIRTRVPLLGYKRHLVSAFAAAVTVALGSPAAMAGDYYLQADMPYGINWTNPTQWFSQPSGGGSNPSSYPAGFAGNDFSTNGFSLRVSATTFAGNSIILGPGWPDKDDMIGLKFLSGTAVLPNLNSVGGGTIMQAENAITTLQVSNFVNQIGTEIYTGGAAKGVGLSINALTGSGDFYIRGGGIVKIGITSGASFTGDILWATTENTTLEFTNDLTSGGKLVVPSNGRINLHQTVTFKSVIINGAALSPGAYSFASLNGSYGDQFIDGGSGSITVQSLPAQDLDLAGYNLVFSDEFNGPLSVSNWGHGTKWIAHKPDGGDFGYGVFTYAPPLSDPYSISNGILSLKAWYSTTDSPSRWHAANLSSVARGGYGFAQRYGYFEARMKFPNKTYAWPSFWLLSTGAFESPQVRTAELDAVEWYGDKPSTAFTTTHRWNFGVDNAMGQTTMVQGMTSGFHTYGVLVKPESITYYIDGMKIFQQPNFPEAQTPLFPLVTYALRQTPPASEQSVVSVTEVDYVRVYEAPPAVTGLIPRNTYAINGVDSQEGTNPGAKAIDGDYTTHWLSASGAAKPHEIKIDLGSPATVSGLRYLPRQTLESLDGLIRDYEVRVSANGSNWTLVDSGTWSNSPLEKTCTFPAQSNIRYISLKDVGTNGALTAAAEINVIGSGSGGPPVAVTSADVGNPSIAGSTTEMAGGYAIQASGADIAGTSDQFRYVYQQLTGDGQITARVSSLVKTNDWAKAGVMMRESLANNSKNATVVMSGHGQCRFQYRTSTGGSTTTSGGTSAFPQWVRLVRSGNTVTGYSSNDGTAWTQVGSVSISMASTIYVGMDVTSHTNTQLTTAIIDNVSWPAAAGSVTSADIGSPGIAGSTSEAGGGYSIQASGADIAGTSDQFRFVYQQLTGDGEITARVSSLVKTNDWAKAGVMMRENLTGNSMNATVVMSGHAQCRFQWRATAGGSTTSVGGTSAFPQWVRLVRSGNTFTGYSSADGTNWTQVSSASISMGSTIYVGLAVTSHTNTQLTTAIIDNVSW